MTKPNEQDLDAENYDVAVIGSGPGGYTAAIRCAQYGLKVVSIDKWRTNNGASLGGTCLNVGCIPSKVLLDISQKYIELQDYHSIGINLGQHSFNLEKIMAYKERIIGNLAAGIKSLFLKHKITSINDTATILSCDKEVKTIRLKTSQKLISAKYIIIATGSKHRNIESCPINGTTIMSSDDVLSLKTIPKTAAILGGGYIGLELGSVLQRLGCKVKVLDRNSSLLASMDVDIGKIVHKELVKQGLDICLNAQVSHVEQNNNKLKVILQDNNGTEETIDTDMLLVAAGRLPCTDELFANHLTNKDIAAKQGVGEAPLDHKSKMPGLSMAEAAINNESELEVSGMSEAEDKFRSKSPNPIQLDERGFIVVDNNLETSAAGVYAIGDVVQGPSLAHKAEEEAIYVANVIANKPRYMNHGLIPSVMYIEPEVASIGLSENTLLEKGIPYKVGKFPLRANSKAIAINKTAGIVKIIVDMQDKIIGAHIVGAHAGIMIHEIAAVMSFGGTHSDLTMICHAHPTLSEAIQEAARDISGMAINF